MGLLKYIIVGVIAWLVDVVVYQLLWPVLGIAGGQAAARLAGAVTAFTLNRRHTFSIAPGSAGIGLQGFKYGLLLALNWGLTVGLIFCFHRGLGVAPLWAKIIADVFVVPCNYWVMKVWVFPRTDRITQAIKEGNP